MTLTSQMVEDILKIYSNNLVSGNKLPTGHAIKELPPQDVVIISEDGKRRIMERFKDEAIKRLKSKG